ncbi:MAG TPA: NRDE family protein [Cyclobacteriaceae bacterium]|nr:NRDE family protein [Cyclobacteriaceae bacterium]
MCLIFLSLQEHPTYKLIVAANRDEFYNRKTEAAAFWKDYPNIVGGRDLEAMGTWMAMTKQGKISLVTNYRDLSNINPHAPSRGQLVADFLLEDLSPLSYLEQVEAKGKLYNGFNLIAGSVAELYYHSNYKAGVEKIKPGLHGLSNHLLDTPWPKVTTGLEKMKSVLSSNDIDPVKLFELLYDDRVAPDEKLPDTGVGLERERMLSSMFIKSPNYGTRCSTVVMVDQDNHVYFAERVYNLSTFEYNTQIFEFKITL